MSSFGRTCCELIHEGSLKVNRRFTQQCKLGYPHSLRGQRCAGSLPCLRRRTQASDARKGRSLTSDLSSGITI
eukprot:5612642-Amphidinium_carterae.3